MAQTRQQHSAPNMANRAQTANEEAAKRAIGAPSHGAAHAPREIRGVRSAIVPELLRSPANARGADE